MPAKYERAERLVHTRRSACDALGVGPTKLHELIQDGKLATVRIGGRTLIPTAELERLAREGDGVRSRRGDNARLAGMASGRARAAKARAEAEAAKSSGETENA